MTRQHRLGYALAPSCASFTSIQRFPHVGYSPAYVDSSKLLSHSNLTRHRCQQLAQLSSAEIQAICSCDESIEGYCSDCGSRCLRTSILVEHAPASNLSASVANLGPGTPARAELLPNPHLTAAAGGALIDMPIHRVNSSCISPLNSGWVRVASEHITASDSMIHIHERGRSPYHLS